MTDDTLRNIASLLYLLAFAGLVHRTVHPGAVRATTLARLVTGLFAIAEAAIALGTWVRGQIGGPFNPVQYGLMVHAVAVIVVCLMWPRLAARWQRPGE